MILSIKKILKRGWEKISKNSTHAQAVGRFGEKQVLLHIKKELGYKVLEKNWCYQRGEIDIIAEDQETVVFIEVKTRQEDAQVPGYYAVDSRKKKILRQTALAYLRRMKRPRRHYRFDIAEVRLGDKRKFVIHYYKNVSFSNHHSITHSY